MTCDICKKEIYHEVGLSIYFISGVCIHCYDSVPDYIPESQIKKFLERKVNGGYIT
jgi:hypothetical protein